MDLKGLRFISIPERRSHVEYCFHVSVVVRLTPNVALRGTATQSETHANTWDTSPFVASYANDGNFDASMTPTSGSCAHTELTPPVWWQVELEKVYEITRVAITQRKEWASKHCFNTYILIVHD